MPKVVVRRDEESEALVLEVDGRRFVCEDVTEEQFEAVNVLVNEAVKNNSWTTRKQLSQLLNVPLEDLVDGKGKPLGVRTMMRMYREIQNFIIGEASEAGKG